jgi:hypothetical protein
MSNETSNQETQDSSDVRQQPSSWNRYCNPKRRLSELIQTLTISELSGSLGDLGTFIPLTTALARSRKISLGPALFWAGICNLITGWKWDVPMCVQPMKSVAALAVSGDVSEGGLDALSVTTAGILTGGAVLLLGISNLMEVVNYVVPLTVVCGIQVGVGMRLASKGMNDVMELTWGDGYDCIGLAVGCSVLSLYWLRENEKIESTEQQDPENSHDSLQRHSNCATESLSEDHANESIELGQCTSNLLNETKEQISRLHLQSSHATTLTASERTSSSHSAIQSPGSFHDNNNSQQLSHKQSFIQQIWNKACCFLHLHPTSPHPVGIYLFLIGCIFAAITLSTDPNSSLHLFGAPIVINALKGAQPSDWRIGFLRGTLPQLPLTTLNSVISVCCLAHELYPEKRKDLAPSRTDAVVTRREVSISVGLMNLLLCPLGSMPNCHGAGGLAGQHRFGARHGTSVVVLGLFKIGLAVFFGGSALALLDALPVAVLGVMVAIAGLELVGTGVGMLVGSVEKEKESRLSTGRSNFGAFTTSKTILREKTLVAMVTASVIIATSRTDYGALAGWVAHMVYGNGFLDFVSWVQKK